MISSTKVIDKQVEIITNIYSDLAETNSVLVKELQNKVVLIQQKHDFETKAKSYEFENSELMREKEVLISQFKFLLMTKHGMTGTQADNLIENVLVGEGLFLEDKEDQKGNILGRRFVCPARTTA